MGPIIIAVSIAFIASKALIYLVTFLSSSISSSLFRFSAGSHSIDDIVVLSCGDAEIVGSYGNGINGGGFRVDIGGDSSKASVVGGSAGTG